MIQPQKTVVSHPEDAETSTEEIVPPYRKNATSAEAGGGADGRLPPRGGTTAVAGGGSGGGPTSLRAGQNIICKLLEKVPDGYNVLLVEHNMEGFIPGNYDWQPGDLGMAQFVCTHRNRVLLTLLLSKK